MVKYANLQGATQDHHLSTSDIVRRTVELDEEFLSLTMNMPSSWLYNTTYLQEASERVFEYHFDTNQDHFTAQTWNVIRIMRILLNGIISSPCVAGRSGSCKETFNSYHQHIATNTIDAMAREICATAPQYTGYEVHTRKNKKYSATQRLGCYTLLFPLYVAGLHASHTTRIRPWIIKQLRFMCTEIGIRNAGVVANILERADETDPWSVYAMLGSYALAA